MQRRVVACRDACRGIDFRAEFHREDEPLVPMHMRVVTIPSARGHRQWVETSLRIALLRWTDAVCEYHDRCNLRLAEMREGRITVRDYADRMALNRAPTLQNFSLTEDDLEYAMYNGWPEARPLDITTT